MHILIDGINDNSRIRGPDRYLLGLLSGLAEIDRENTYTVCHAPWQPFLAQQALPENFKRLCLDPPRRRSVRVLWHRWVFPRIVARCAPDVVHLPNIIHAPVPGRPTAMTVHDLAHFRHPEKFGPLRGRLQRHLIRAALRNPVRVIAVSDFTRGDLARFTSYPEARVRVIHEGAPVPSLCEADAAPTGTGRPYFLYVGQIERSKNVEGLVEAFLASALLRGAGAELRIVGRAGNAAARVLRCLRGQDTAQVRMLGYVDDSELAGLYRGCTAFVFPSLVEGFGLVLLEAMAYGAPVVAMRATAVPEVVGNAAMLVEPGHPEALRTAMETLLQDGVLRAELIRRGHERVRQFDWVEAARSTLAIYREVCL